MALIGRDWGRVRPLRRRGLIRNIASKSWGRIWSTRIVRVDIETDNTAS